MEIMKKYLSYNETAIDYEVNCFDEGVFESIKQLQLHITIFFMYQKLMINYNFINLIYILTATVCVCGYSV